MLNEIVDPSYGAQRSDFRLVVLALGLVLEIVWNVVEIDVQFIFIFVGLHGPNLRILIDFIRINNINNLIVLLGIDHGVLFSLELLITENGVGNLVGLDAVVACVYGQKLMILRDGVILGLQI